ncbi:uncharacterized protein EV422DRAFT_478676, partial [Fimicolochytrium jonesii]|uniref:uncharacterized protein n=1 Tax=Fimicolochytrium jonesii TaxID=1396493 RepID=UPI0022FEA33F
SMLNSVSASTDDLEKLPVPEEPRTLCHCGFSINENDPTSCGICGGFLEPLEKLTSEKARLSAELLDLKRKVRLMEQRQDASTHEMAILRDRCTELEEITAAKEAELSSVRADLDRLGQRLVDEVEVRAELQYSKDAMKDAMQEELEELTRSLFEEANSLVATEARHRYEHQQKEAGLRMQMEEMTLQLQMERDQLKELRARMETIEAERSLRGSANDVGGSLPRLNIHGSDDSMNTNSSSSPAPTYEDAIDPVLFAEFDEFVTAKSDIKLGKMHTLPFMKNALEDDVSPCLRFGGNPRTSTRRLIDAIIANTCFVEEISPAQQANMEAARQGRPTEASRTASPRASISPSRTASTNAQHNRSGGVLTEYESVTPTAKTAQPSNNVFNRSVMERLSNAFGGGSMTLSSSHQSLSSLANSCSACGSRGGQSTSTRFQFKTSDSPEEGWNPICQQCRDRLVAVCEFYNFARHVRQGLYSTRRREDLYMEVLSYKRRMFYARIGCARFAETDRTFSSRRPRPNSSVISPITGSIAMLEEPPALPPS